MSFRPPWKHQEQQNAAWVHQSGFRSKQFHRRGGTGSGDQRDHDRRSPWAPPNRSSNFPNKDVSRIPSLFDLPSVGCPPSTGVPSIWEQPPPVFEGNTPQNSGTQVTPQPVPPPALLPPPPVPLSLLLQGEIWDVNNGQSRPDVKGNPPPDPIPSKHNVEVNVRREMGASESHSGQEEMERKPETDDLLDSISRYHEEFQASKYGINSQARSDGSSCENTSQNICAPRDNRSMDSVTQKLLNRVTLMEKHNIKQVINDPEPKYESALKKRATQLIRANVRQRLRHFSVEERAESESEQRDIEADMFVDSDKMPEVVFNEIKNMMGLEVQGGAPIENTIENSIDNSMVNSIEPDSMFMEFDRAIEENLPLDAFDPPSVTNHEPVQPESQDFVIDELTIKENVTLSRVNRESTEMLGDSNTLDSVMNEAVDANALSPLMTQNDDEHNIRAFADNGIAICTPSEDVVKEDKAQVNLLNNISSNNTGEPLSKELQSYKIPKKQKFIDRRSRRDDRNPSAGRRSHEAGKRRYDRYERRSRSRGSSRSRERDFSRARRENFIDRSRRTPERNPQRPPEPEKRPPEPEPESKLPIRPRPVGGKKFPEENRKRPPGDHPDAMAKRKRFEKKDRATDTPQRSWLSPGEKKCLPQESNEVFFGPKYKNKCVQTQFQPMSPTKSLAERELKIFHEMKQIDTSLMEMQRKKIEIDEQIQKLQSELMSIEMQSMKLQNTRFDLLNRILTIPVGHVDALVESDFEATPVKKKEKNVRFEEEVIEQETSKKAPEVARPGPASKKRLHQANTANKVPNSLTKAPNQSNTQSMVPPESQGAKKKKKPLKPKRPVEESQTKEPPKVDTPKPNPAPVTKEKKLSKLIKVKLEPVKKKSPAPVAKVVEPPRKVATPEPPIDWSKVLKDFSIHVDRLTREMIKDSVSQPQIQVEKEGTKDNQEPPVQVKLEVDPKKEVLSTEWQESLVSTLKSPILHMELSQGFVFASAEDDRSLYRFSWDDEKRVKSVQLHEKSISSFLCHENGFVYTISSDGFVRQCNCRDFEESVGEFYCGGALEIISCASWGQLYIVRHDKKILVFDAKNLSDNQELNCETSSKIVNVVGSEVDGQKVISVASQGNEFSIRNAESGDLIKRFHLEWTIDYFIGHDHVIQCGIDGKDLIHYKIMTGEEIARCNIGQKVIRVKHLAEVILILCNNGTVYVWNSVENQFIGVVKGPDAVIKAFDVENNKIFILTSQDVFWSCTLPEGLLPASKDRSNHPKSTCNSKLNEV